MLKYLILIALLMLVSHRTIQILNRVEIHHPAVIVPVIPSPIDIPDIVPEPKVDDDVIFVESYQDAVNLAKQRNKNLLIIFSANWCKYCQHLKNDKNKITEWKNKIVCFIDVDLEKKLINEYGIKILPTSIILKYSQDGQVSELARISGYKYDSYKEWLKKH